MRIGVAIEETWSFLHEIYADLSAHHQTSLFQRRAIKSPAFSERINRYVYKRDWQKFLRENEVVFFEWASGLLAYATNLEKTCGIVTRLHRYELYQWAKQINWDHVDKIILVSQAKRREFNSRFPEQASKIVVIPEAISVAKFQPANKEYHGDIGILCHLTPRKRVYEAILTFYELLQQQAGFHLHIGGGEHILHGDYYRALQTIVRELGLEDKVTFYGNIPNPEAWYPQIDIFLSNSYSEGLQVAPIEAMACGRYVLSHRWEGADELLPEENLYSTDRELIARILEYSALPDKEKKARCGLLTQSVHSKFNMDQVKAQIRNLIEEVGRGGHQAPDKR